MSDDHDDEQAKKRRLPPSSEHQTAAEEQAQRYLDDMLKQADHAMQREAELAAARQQAQLTPRGARRPDCRQLQSPHQAAVEQEDAREKKQQEFQIDKPDQRSIKEDDHRLATAEPAKQAPSLDRRHTPGVPVALERMTDEQRRRHEGFVDSLPQPVSERTSVKAARILTLEYEKRHAPELGALRTTLSNDAIDREHRKKHTTENAQSRDVQLPARASDAEDLSRAQDRQAKHEERQTVLREQGTDVPAEKIQEVRAEKALVQQRRAQWGDEFKTTAEEREAVEKSQHMQQSRGLGRTR